MYRIVLCFMLLLGCKTIVFSQVFPGEGSQLHFRIIGFTVPAQQNVDSYKVEIAFGSFKNADSFQKHIFAGRGSKVNKIICEVPSFGKRYTWRVVYTDKNAVERKGSLYHFSTLTTPDVDTSMFRLRVIKQAEKYKDAYVFLDLTRTLYDMKGNPVWFLPNVKMNTVDSTVPTMDLKPTDFGTLTYIFSTGIYEINYYGDTLWKGPENNTIESDKNFNHYHHEFTRLKNGNYMVLGGELFMYKVNTSKGDYLLPYSDSFFNRVLGNREFYKLRMGTITEYNSKGNIEWLWKSSKYLHSSDLEQAMRLGLVRQLHDNAFYFDEDQKSVYLSLRVVSRILKIRYPEGNVTNSYGLQAVGNLKEIKKWNNLFCDQHSCRRSKDGYLYLYNNNNCNGGVSSIVMLKEPTRREDTLKTIWEFECNFDGDGISEPRPPGSGGGNVFEMPDGSIFCSTGYFAGKVFIVNRDKKLLWSALPEKWNESEKRWEMTANYRSSYRASIILDRAQLETLIWNGQNSK